MTPFEALLALALAVPHFQETPSSAVPTLRERFDAVTKEFVQAEEDFRANYEAAKSDEERQVAFQARPKADEYAARFLAIARDAGKEAIGLESCGWVLERVQSPGVRDETYALILAHHVEKPKLGEVVRSVRQHHSTAGSERFLRAVLEKSPRHDVMGLATYSLANVLIGLARLHEELAVPASMPEGRAMYGAYYGAETLDEIGTRDPQEMRDEAGDLLEDVVADYPNVKGLHAPLGLIAENDLFELRNLQIGMTAPDIVGADVDGVAFKLSDYRGKVVVLDFWGFW